jgi:hypothetical protein
MPDHHSCLAQSQGLYSDLGVSPQYAPGPRSHPLPHLTLLTTVATLYPEYTDRGQTSGPLHLLFPLPDAFLP